MPEDKNEKQLAAEAAVHLVEDGMIVGLGSGSTADYAIRAIGDLVAKGMNIKGIPTSSVTQELAIEVGIPLTTLSENPVVDITIDGADKFDDRLSLIKGGGGALLREKIVAASSSRLVIIADSSKHSSPLGDFPVPLEVIPFGVKPVLMRLEALGFNPSIRKRSESSEHRFRTDEGNFIIDLDVAVVKDPKSFASQLNLPGVVEHGLFIEMVDDVFMGIDGNVKHFTPKK